MARAQPRLPAEPSAFPWQEPGLLLTAFPPAAVLLAEHMVGAQELHSERMGPPASVSLSHSHPNSHLCWISPAREFTSWLLSLPVIIVEPRNKHFPHLKKLSYQSRTSDTVIDAGLVGREGLELILNRACLASHFLWPASPVSRVRRTDSSSQR